MDRLLSGPNRFAWIPLPVLFVAVTCLWFKDIQAPHESVGLLIALNLLLATLPALVIAFLFARRFLVTGAAAMALFGCGALIWSVSGLAPLAASLAPGPWLNINATVTIHNVTVWGAALCYLAGAALLQQPHPALPNPERALVASYALALAVAAFIVFMAIREWTPVFFVQGKGGSEERQFVLGTTIITILLTLFLVHEGPRQRPSAFLGWFVLALLLFVIGYAGQMLQTNSGSVLSWLSRAAQFLGGGYMLAAAYAAFRGGSAPFEVRAESLEGAPHRYGVAVALVITATVARLVFLPSLETRAAFIGFFPAVMLAAFYGGFRAGMLAAILSAALADYFWIDQPGGLIPVHPVDWLTLAVFLIVCLLISSIVDSLQQAQSRLHQAEVERRAELERMVAARTAELGFAKTEAERVKEQERQKREELEMVQQAIPAGVFIAEDAACTRMTVNPAGQELLRISGNANPSKSAPSGEAPRNFEIVSGGRVLKPEELPMQRAAATGSAIQAAEFEVQFTEGDSKYLTGNALPLFDGAGRVRGAVGAFLDITGRKKIEEEALASKANLEAALSSMTDAVIISDAQGRFVHINGALAKFYRFKRKEDCAKTFAEYPALLDLFLPNGELAPLEQWVLPRALRGETATHAEYTLRRKDTGETWVGSYNFAPIRNSDGEIVGAVVTARDITEHKKAEAALRESQQRLEGLIQSAMDAIIAIDASQRIVLFNPAAEKMFGYPASEALGGSIDRFIPEPARDAHRDHVRTFDATGIQKSPFGPFRGVRESGEEFPIEASISQVQVGGQKLYTVILRDITERKRHEEHTELLMREVNHRAKNMLAVVLSIARQTAAKKPDDFIARFSDRIQALSASQDLLVQNEWKGVGIAALVESQLAHFQDLIGTRIKLKGPRLLISASAAQTIGMALHELSTNAGKYGALSNRDGRLEIGWSLEWAGGDEEAFVMYWREQGGPSVQAPARRGFGSTVIERMAKEALDAEVNLDFAAEGLFWSLRCPAKEAVESEGSST